MTGMFTLLRWGLIAIVFSLVTACGGGGGGGGNTPAANKPPVITLAAPDAVQAGETVTLDASGSSDPDGKIASITWQRVSGPQVNLGKASGPKLAFEAPDVEKDQELVLRVTVKDDKGASKSREFTILVHAVIPDNENPVADAGADVTVSVGAGVTLDGSASRDADGQVVSFAWTQIEGNAVTLDGANTATASFIAPNAAEETLLTFRLTVTDDRGATASDTVVVTVTPVTGGNRPPAIGGIDGLPEGPVRAGETLTLTINASDPDEDELSFEWELIAPSDLEFEGVTFPATTAELTLPLPDVSADTFVRLRARVSDGNQQDSEEVEFEIEFDNQLPTVSLVTDPADLVDVGIQEGQPFTITAEAVDPDGKPGLTYTWAQTAGSIDFSDELANVTGPELALTAPDVTADEAYGFQVTVRDADGGETVSEEILFTVSFVNQAPVANAGADTSGDENAEITLNGEASFDPDGEAITYQWTQTEGAPAAFIGDSNVANPTIRLPEIDSASMVLTFSLVVMDIHGVPSAADTVNVTVNNVNRAPVIGSVDGPASIDEGTDLAGVILQANDVTDPDGDNFAYQWTLPAGFVARNGTNGAALEIAGTPDIGPSDDGSEYTFTLRVTDDGAPAAFTEATHVLRLNFVNKVPRLVSAYITGDRSITEGAAVQLVAVAHDGDLVNGDEQDLTYTWTLIDDGGFVGLPDEVQNAELSFIAPEVESDSVVVRYRVVANDGLDDSNPPAEIAITIEPDRSAPEIIAPEILDVDEGENISFTLSPTVSDNRTPVGELDYEWIVPNGFSIQTGSDRQRELVITATPDVGPEGGSGTFGLNVTDTDGNSANITFDVTVNFVNQAPVLGTIDGSRTVNDGTTGNTLSASGTDPDDQPLVFEWTRSANDTSGISDEALGVVFPTIGEQLTFNAPDVTEDTTIMFSVIARDDLDLASEPLEIVVEISSDPAPVIEGFEPAAPALDEGTALDINVSATDFDRSGTDATEHLVYEWTNIPQEFDVSGVDSATLSILDTPDVGPGGEDYNFTVTVHDQDGNSVSRDISVHVGFVNAEPVVGDVEIRDSSGAPVAAVPEGGTDLVFSVDVADADEDEGQAMNYEWSVPEGFTVIGGINNATLRVSGTPNVIADTTFDTFSVQVSDGVAAPVVKSASLVVNFVNQRPTAHAGTLVEVPENADLPAPQYILDASGSFDPDNDDGADQTLTYRWTWSTLTGIGLQSPNGSIEIDGGSATLVTTDSIVSVSAVPDVTEDTLVPVTLHVDDGSGAANSLSEPKPTTIRVRFVNQDPVINAVSASPADPDEGETVLLSADVDDPDGQPLSVTWSQLVQGNETPVEIMQNGDGTASFTAPDVGPENMALSFIVTVDDGLGGVVDSSGDPLVVTVTFVNEDPIIETATATPNPADEGAEVTLSGSATDPDGQEVTLTWSQIEGDERNVNVVNDGNGSATFIAPDVTGSEGLVLDFILTADDGAGGVIESDPVSVPIRFLNTPPDAPVAFANPATPNEGETVTLFAAASDPDRAGNVEYIWTQSTDDPVQVSIIDNGDLTFGFVAPDVGPSDNLVLNFEVIARDADHAEHGNGESEPAAVAVPITFVNQQPTIDSFTASPQSVTPGTEVTLAVAASDVDGQVLTYDWRQIDNGAPIVDLLPQGSSATFIAPNVTSLDGHTLEFEVVVDDQSGASNATASDTASVNLVFENTAPAIGGVAASPDSVDEEATFTLVADVTDPDQALGQTLSYTWMQRDGEPVAGIVDNGNGTATVTAPAVDADTTLHFSVTVSDGVAPEAMSDEVAVEVIDTSTRADQFIFSDLTQAAPGMNHTSAITISGLDPGVAVPITLTNGTASINGGPFVAQTDGVLVENGDVITLKLQAPETGGQATQATLTTSDGATAISDTFDVTAAVSELDLFTSFKTINLSWSEMQGVDTFELWYQPDQNTGFVRVAEGIPGTETGLKDDGLYHALLTGTSPKGWSVHLMNWEPDHDNYQLRACNAHTGCVPVPGHQARVRQADSIGAIGYFKSSPPAALDEYGTAVAVSTDGQTLIVGVPYSDFNGMIDNGAIRIYRKNEESVWEHRQLHQGFLDDGYFGQAVDTNADGTVIAVGSPPRKLLTVFQWSEDVQTWSRRSDVSAPPTCASRAGESVAVSADGNVIAVGAPASSCEGEVEGEAYGEVLVYRRVAGEWGSEPESVFSEIRVSGEEFGLEVSLNAAGNRLFVATNESVGEVEVFEHNPDSNEWVHVTTVPVNRPNGKVSVNGLGDSFISGSAIYRQTDALDPTVWEMEVDLVNKLAEHGVLEFVPDEVALSADNSAAVLLRTADPSLASGVHSTVVPEADTRHLVGGGYVFWDSGDGWDFQRYVKASNPEAGDSLGVSADFGDGSGTLVIGAPEEDGGIGGVNPENAQGNNSKANSGAVYVY